MSKCGLIWVIQKQAVADTITKINNPIRIRHCRNRVTSCNITYVVQQDTQLLLWLNIYSQYGRTEQHTVFTYQTSNTQFIDAPEDGPVGPKHVELSNIL